MVISDEKLELILQVQQERLKARSFILKKFLIDDPAARPFAPQLAFFRDCSLARLLRAGNRGAKTFSAMRDLSWKITRTHPYNHKYNVFGKDGNWFKKIDTEDYEFRYMNSKPKIFWMVGPTYEFVKGVMWEMYLNSMIPEWFVEEVRYTNQKNIESVIFKNGDVLKCKTYAQQDTTKMGFAVDEVYIDEMPPDLMTITELLVRTLDKDGGVTMAFTPLVTNTEIRRLLDGMCEEGTMSLHSWSFTENPHYRDNPERLARAMDAYKHMPENEKAARIRGDWYYEMPNKAVFEGIDVEIVEDFPIPLSWRQARVTDPASHVTGLAILAEDPATGDWYCTLGKEISWEGGKLAKAEDILTEIESLRPHPKFKYCMSLYDNAEAWFGAYGHKYGFTACILKKREEAIMRTRDSVGRGRIKFFRIGAAKAIEQIRDYHYADDGKTVVKKNDHVLDCIMYFSRQIPEYKKQQEDSGVDYKQEILDDFIARQEKSLNTKNPQRIQMNKIERRLMRRPCR